IEKIFNNINEEKLNDLVYNLGFINFIALDQMFHFDNNKRILEIKKYCLKLANVSNYDEKLLI
ncbi:hypothetical protein EJP17_07820, partial [Campylobacter jejuni]|nr:hypothetical protein [Campylobacter jejuni]